MAKEVEITIENGVVTGNLVSGFPQTAEAENVLEKLMAGVGYKEKTGHKPHQRRGVKSDRKVGARGGR